MSKKKVLLRGVFINRDTNGEGVLKVGTTLIRVSTVMGILYSNSRYCINGSFESENRYCAYNVEMKKWKKYLESLNDISEIDNVIEKAAALKHQDLYKIACEIKQSKL